MKKTEKIAVGSLVLNAGIAAFLITYVVWTKDAVLAPWAVLVSIRFVTSVFVVLGMRISERHTETFPLGLYKLENLLQTCVGFVIMFFAYEVAKIAIGELSTGTSVPLQLDASIFILVASAAIAGIAAWYKAKVGKEENSPSLSADAKHSWTDALASFAIIIGVALEWAGVPDMDSIAALVVVLFLAWSGVEVVISGVKVLLDASIEKELLEKARDIAAADLRIREVLEVNGRNSGSYRFMELLLVPTDYDLRDATAIEEDLISAIRKEIDNVDQVLIDFAAEPGRRLLGAVPVDKEGSFGGRLSDASTIEFLEVDEHTGKEVSRESLVVPFDEDLPGRGVHVSVLLARRGVDILFIGEKAIESAASAVLEENGVKMPPRSDIETTQDVLEALVDLVNEAKD
jgi:cation diffusion facilitator family transporter